MQASPAGPNCSAKECAVFDSCVLATVHAALAESTSCVRKVRTPAGADVFHQGTPQAGMSILCAGVARLNCFAASGRNVLLRLCWPGEILSVPTLPTHPYSCQVEHEGWVATIDRTGLRELVAKDMRVRLEVLEKLAAQNARYVQRIAILATQGARGRLAGVLSSLAQEAGMRPGDGELPVELSAKDLGEMAGCSRQTASLYLGKMEKAGVITRESGALTVVRPELL
ncbi:MAG: Crp/Fnr family transcriptional regulator [Candidatus Bipolaricaulota bacterium]